jgi:hypothetical protein
MAKYEVLPGLPPYGPSAEGFSATGQGKHREGLVVRFFPRSGESWVGNFQRGWGGCDAVFEYPEGTNIVIVVAGGQGYIVDPEARQCMETFGGSIESAHHVPELNAVVLGDGLWFEAMGPAGLLWRSGRISWDGMCELNVDGLTLSGKAGDPDGRWTPFTLDLRTGEFDGGSYYE